MGHRAPGSDSVPVAMAPGSRSDLPYQPFYCEENAWWLCAHPALGPGPRQVVFLTSLAGCCPMLQQRAAAPGALMPWDYHVVVVDGAARVWDLDSRLPLPCPVADYLGLSFALAPRLPGRFAPRLRLIGAPEYVQDFASDRRHMRDPDGGWMHPPPSWPAIGRGHRLPAYLDPVAAAPGRLLTLEAAWVELAGMAGSDQS